MTVATYVVNYVEEGVWGNDTPFLQSSESLVLPSKSSNIEEIKALFARLLDKKYGNGKYSLSYFVGIKEIESGFHVEKSTVPGLEGALSLKGFGVFLGHCHTLSSVNIFLNSPLFRIRHSDLVPIFEKAKSVMEQGTWGYIQQEPC